MASAAKKTEINVAKDALITAITNGFFKNKADASEAYIFQSRIEKLRISDFRRGKYENFNPERLSTEPYPPSNRPRGKADLASVAYHRKVLLNGGASTPVVVVERPNGSRYLLDGSHRVVASFLEKRKQIVGIVIAI